MSVMSRGFFGSHATAALQVITLPLVAVSWSKTSLGTLTVMLKCVSSRFSKELLGVLLSLVFKNQNDCCCQLCRVSRLELFPSNVCFDFGSLTEKLPTLNTNNNKTLQLYNFFRLDCFLRNCQNHNLNFDFPD